MPVHDLQFIFHTCFNKKILSWQKCEVKALNRAAIREEKAERCDVRGYLRGLLSYVYPSTSYQGAKLSLRVKD